MSKKIKGLIGYIKDAWNDGGYYPGVDKWESGTKDPQLAVKKMDSWRESVGQPKMNNKQKEAFLKHYHFKR